MLFKIFKTAKIENRTKKFFYMYADFQNIFSFFQYHKGEVTVGKKFFFFLIQLLHTTYNLRVRSPPVSLQRCI